MKNVRQWRPVASLVSVIALILVLAAPALAQTPIPTTTTLTSSLNPSYVGDVVTLTGTACLVPGSQRVGCAPVGTITFQDGGQSIASCTSLTVSNGVVTCTLLALTAGNHNMTAVYSGDICLAPSNSPVLVQAVLPRADPPEVPEAGTFILFGSGLSGLAAWWRFKRAKR